MVDHEEYPPEWVFRLTEVNRGIFICCGCVQKKHPSYHADAEDTITQQCMYSECKDNGGRHSGLVMCKDCLVKKGWMW